MTENASDQVAYRKADRKDVARIAELATASFGSYPFFDFALRGAFATPESYSAYLERLHRVHARAFMRSHACIVGVLRGAVVSVAILQDPKARPAGVWDYIASGGAGLAFPVGVPRILDFLSLCKQAEQDCLREHPGAWYLEMLAVDASMKGRGLGGAMLRDCLVPYVRERAGSELTLITNTARNCGFYKKNGFTEFARRPFERNGQKVDTWSFWREVG